LSQTMIKYMGQLLRLTPSFRAHELPEALEAFGVSCRRAKLGENGGRRYWENFD